MKLKILISAIFVLFPLLSMAISISDFKQPYPAGNAMEGNPNFIGMAWLDPLSREKEINVPMFNVTFESGCHTGIIARNRDLWRQPFSYARTE